MTDNSTNNTSLLRKRQTSFEGFQKQQEQIQNSPKGKARSASRAKRLAEMTQELSLAKHLPQK